ncbi:LOW QUALITY PROTEIN: hypothetical protein QTO34_014256 [Cnephaeus nilssonii]|uniref:Peptidase M14 domain-containing protein n=1 Tax=Cnephaeus nilssonii TaxID=3371016 RepID=A0AA40I608_CNENI|nr:LOW QUALITY PROTEIN: hypothetical protein QTO34_014256 [Eptesicus nilssonii]
MQNAMPGSRYSTVAVLPKRKKKELSSTFVFSFILIPQIAFVLKIVAWTEKTVHKHPDMVSRIKIGTTVENNPLYVLKIGKKDERRKAIFMDCGIHAREWISPAFCQWFVYQATKTYGENKIMTKLLDLNEFLCSSCVQH